jgi:hypothetical protein
MKFFLLGLAGGSLFLCLFFGLGFGSKTEQPITFSHKRHVDQGLECAACHQYFKTQNFSGMPDIHTCMECHNEAITKNPQEEKIRQFAKKGEEIPWKRIYGEPDHVFFSHRRHVVLGKLQCQTCHGNIAERERPPSRPWVNMTMNWCMNCHTKNKVTNDCLACHV